MSHARLKLGQWGEQRAAQYLRQRLYRIVATNYSNKCGEVDIIARRGRILAFIEVKTRRSVTFGTGAEAVNAHKQRQIIRTAHIYLQQHPKLGALQPRFDIIAVQVEPGSGGQCHIEHIADAFGV